MKPLTNTYHHLFSFVHFRKDAKKVSKLEAQIPYHEGRGNKEEVEKIKQQVAEIWVKTREAAFAE
jgi:hypothetical protein